MQIQKITIARIKNALYIPTIILLVFIIGYTTRLVEVEGKRMYKEITEMNSEVDEYFKTDGGNRDQAVSPEKVVQGTTHIRSDEEVAPIKSEVSVAETSTTSLEALVLESFNGDRVALAVAKAESGLNPLAQGFNCYYNGKSQSCNKGDEHKAWSTDCGLMQINFIGKECPKDMFEPRKNLAKAKEMFDKRNWQPWYAFKSGAYLAHM